MSKTLPSPADHAQDILNRLAVSGLAFDGGHAVRSPIDGQILAHVAFDDARTVEAKIAAASRAFRDWRSVPAPRRGELVRLLGEELRAAKSDLAQALRRDLAGLQGDQGGEV